MYIKWEDIKKYNKCISVYDKFYRDNLIEHNYSLKRKDGNIDFINFLKSSTNPFTLTYAEYPYYFEPGLVHFILWLHLPILYDDIIFVEKVIEAVLPRIPKHRVIFFKNAKNNRSIKNICHYHVIVNMK